MHRFILFTLLIAACGGSVQARPKPELPAISVCYGQVCLSELRWRNASAFGNSLPSVEGVFVNNSNLTFTSLALQFDLKAGHDLRGSAVDSFTGRVPPGGRWLFHAFFENFDGSRFVTQIDSGVLDAVALGGDVTRRFVQPLRFDPLFGPYYSKQRKEWEKIHGARQR